MFIKYFYGNFKEEADVPRDNTSGKFIVTNKQVSRFRLGLVDRKRR